MKVSSIICFLLSTIICFAQKLPSRKNLQDTKQQRQGEWSIYMNGLWQLETDTSKIAFYRLINYRNDKPIGVVKDFYRNGQIQFEGTLIQDRPEEIYDGLCKWYYNTGEVRIEQKFKEGALIHEKVMLKSGAIADDKFMEHFDLSYAFANEQNYKAQAAELEVVIENTEALIGRESEEYAELADKLGIALYLSDNRDKAIIYHEAFVEVRKLIHPQPDTLMLTKLSDLGSFYKLKKEWIKAEKSLRDFIKLNSEYFNGKHPDYPDAIQTFGTVCEALKKYDESLKYLTEAKKIFDLDPAAYEYPRLSNTFSLSGLYLTMGELTKAEQLLANELKAFKKTYGEKSDIYLTALGLLARIHEGAGNYVQAETEWQQQLELERSINGDQSLNVAAILGSLAEVSAIRGEVVKADQYIQQANKIYSIQKEYDASYLEFLGKQANVQSLMGNNKATLELSEKKRIIAEKIFGNNSLQYAETLKLLAEVTYGNKQWDLCEKYAQQALKIYSAHDFDKFNDQERTSWMILQSRLGTLYLTQYLLNPNGIKLAAAEEHLNEALAAFHSFSEQLFSYNIVDTYLSMALVYEMQGLEKKADEKYNYVYKSVKKQWGEKHPFLIKVLFLIAKKSEIRKNYPQTKANYKNAISLHSNYIHHVFPYLSEIEKEQFYETNKDMISGFQGFAAQYHSQLSELSEMWYNLLLTQKGIVLQSFNPIREAVFNSGNASIQKLFDEWQQAKNEYAKLVQDEASSAKAKQTLSEKLNDIEKNISSQANTININFTPPLVEWTDVKRSLKPAEAAVEIIYAVEDREEGRDSAYFALIVKPTSIHPVVVKLGAAAKLEGKAFKYFRNAIKFKQTDSVSYALFWKPMEKELRDSKIIFISSDGVFHQLNLATLFNPITKKYIQEEKNIRAIPSTSWLANRETNKIALTNVTLFAHPKYGGRSVAPMELTRSLDVGNVVDLPGTQQELIGIESLLKSKGIVSHPFEGVFATEEALKKVHSPAVLHIATHGYFLQAVKTVKEKFTNPLLRSGLLLAGCQLKPHLSDSTREDGILTAYEASTLPLYKTKLVALSACETGLGEIKNGEGVYGLQRAFFMAGAERLLMSLWKVDDEATQQFMIAFYQEWGKTNSIDLAFLKAQQNVKEKFPEPFYWGAFVLDGRP